MSELRVVGQRGAEPAPNDERTRRVFLAIRRALLLICAAIEREFGADADRR